MSGLVVLSACGARSALELSTVDERAASPFGGAPGIGGVPNATGGAPASPVRVTAISAGADHTCGVAAGMAKCWGYNDLGELGNGARLNSLVPVNVTGLSSGVLAISAGGASCALTSTGAAKCWGPNSYRQLGSDSGNSLLPVDVDSLSSGVASVSVGGFAACAVLSGGVVRCWGNPDLGNGRSPFPLDVQGLTGVVSVSAGYGHVCAVTAVGAVKCWGRNDVGELGNRSSGDSLVPVDVEGLSSDVLSVSAGYHQTCAVTFTGAVKCWGSNSMGQLGNNSTVDSRVPVDVVGLSSGVLSVSAGDLYTCAVTSMGAVKCWGSNMWGTFGDPTTTSTSFLPVDVVGLSANVMSVSVGENHACALTSTGAVKCWGKNDFGQLGNGSTIGSSVPVDVLGL